MLMSLARPKSRDAAQSRMAVHSAPDCEITEMTPRAGVCRAKEALRSWSVLISPKQLGPRRCTPREVHRRSSSASSRAPSGPTSLKPAVMVISALAPASMACSAAACTCFVGTAITAISTGRP
jgi:hypothetical protein